jgi:hypothetical protein
VKTIQSVLAKLPGHGDGDRAMFEHAIRAAEKLGYQYQLNNGGFTVALPETVWEDKAVMPVLISMDSVHWAPNMMDHSGKLLYRPSGDTLRFSKGSDLDSAIETMVRKGNAKYREALILRMKEFVKAAS